MQKTTSYFKLINHLFREKLFLLICFLSVFQINGQEIKVDKFILENELNEISGLIYWNTDTILSVNDGGNPSIIYALNEKGEIFFKKELPIKNIDWEDLAIDNENNIYIGDFGNNYSKRQNLRIFKLSGYDLFQKEEVKIEKIRFNFEDQNNFPPGIENRIFDCESMFHLKNELIIITKNKSKPFNEISYVYKIPDHEGEFTAKKIDSIELKGSTHFNSMITGADYNPTRDIVYILFYNKILEFENYSKLGFSKNVAKKINIKFGQNEAIATSRNGDIWISRESSKKTGQKAKLYRIQFD